MNAIVQASSEQTENKPTFMDINLTPIESLEMLTKIESMPEAYIAVQEQDPETVGTLMRRSSTSIRSYDIWISGVESVHKLVLKADGTWHIKTTIAI